MHPHIPVGLAQFFFISSAEMLLHGFPITIFHIFHRWIIINWSDFIIVFNRTNRSYNIIEFIFPVVFVVMQVAFFYSFPMDRIIFDILLTSIFCTHATSIFMPVQHFRKLRLMKLWNKLKFVYWREYEMRVFECIRIDDDLDTLYFSMSMPFSLFGFIYIALSLVVARQRSSCK